MSSRAEILAIQNPIVVYSPVIKIVIYLDLSYNNRARIWRTMCTSACIQKMEAHHQFSFWLKSLILQMLIGGGETQPPGEKNGVKRLKVWFQDLSPNI